MARFADLIGPAATPPEPDATPVAPVADPVATHDDVTAALSALIEPSASVVHEDPAPLPGEPVPDPAAALAAAFRTELPAQDPAPDAEPLALAPRFDDDLLPTRVVKSRRR